MEELKKFLESFFKNLKSNILEQGNLMIIESVLESFEKFYGKKSPYKFVFTESDKTLDSEAELITKGSFLISCMRDFLESKGQTTLLMINFKLDPREQIKNNFLFKNAELSGLNKKEIPKSMIRFTFQTTFQYLNEKEQAINEVYIENGKVIEFNLNNYEFSEGKKETINIGNIKKEYFLAKERLKTILDPQIQKMSQSLDKKLEKELERIKQHFKNQELELGSKLEDSERQLKQLEKQDPSDITILNKIKKLKQTIEEINLLGAKEKLRKEEQFFLNDETHKHALALNTKLINTTIICYPSFILSGYLKNANSIRVLNLNYNPLESKFETIICDCCKSPIVKIGLCSSGHLSCEKCLRACQDCQKEYCSVCLNHTCFTCGKKICRKCTGHCSKCHKDKCSNHMSSSNICQTCQEKSSQPRVKLF